MGKEALPLDENILPQGERSLSADKNGNTHILRETRDIR